MTVYRVTARRSGDWWALEVPDLPGVFSQAKRLEAADRAAREAIASMLDLEPEGVRVTVEPDLNGDADKAVADADAARRIADEAAAQAQAAMQAAAALLTKTMSQRDAGLILGVSFQRISQLLSPAQKEAAVPKVPGLPARKKPSTKKGALDVHRGRNPRYELAEQVRKAKPPKESSRKVAASKRRAG
ncbi:hypothetical protein [Streptomyces pristinaespiralis]|uniref:hypothetical protein n=1 Tax=Streptomyces pristinaespiralis TaxID=38300 RepID=UPI0038343ED6